MINITKDQLLSAEEALCKEIDPDLWFPSNENSRVKSSYEAMNYAKSVCARCPIVVQCLAHALSNKEEHGIWGGSSPNERKRIKTVAQAKQFLVQLQTNAESLGSLAAKRKRLR
jgi:WhiB family redox-sensing transcriptional regulator